VHHLVKDQIKIILLNLLAKEMEEEILPVKKKFSMESSSTSIIIYIS